MSWLDTTMKSILSIVGITNKGQATKANSFPVVLASDTDPLGTIRKAGTVAVVPAAAITVGTGATLILAANANRLSFNITNSGTVRIYLGLDNTVGNADNGKHGGWIDPGDVFSESYTGDIYGRVASGSGAANYMEVRSA